MQNVIKPYDNHVKNSSAIPILRWITEVERVCVISQWVNGLAKILAKNTQFINYAPESSATLTLEMDKKYSYRSDWLQLRSE